MKTVDGPVVIHDSGMRLAPAPQGVSKLRGFKWGPTARGELRALPRAHWGEALSKNAFFDHQLEARIFSRVIPSSISVNKWIFTNDS
jgi:hypothetical protein